MKRMFRLAIALVALACLAPGVAQAQKQKKLYVSLGDSLSVGVQSAKNGNNVLSRQGFAHQLARSAGVKLKQFGCAGATSGSLIKGNRKCVGPSHNPGYKNSSAKTSQLATATRFIKKNRKRIAFVTIDVGANDVASCGDGGQIDLQCVNDGIAAIKKNGPVIAKRLRKAGGKKVPMAVTTFYDPFLQQWFNGQVGQAVAKASVDIARKQVNPTIVNAFKPSKFKIARTAEAFDTYVPFERTTTLNGQAGVPVAVAQVCKLTFMCKPAPQGPDIHTNKAGYKVMAAAYKKALGKAAK